MKLKDLITEQINQAQAEKVITSKLREIGLSSFAKIGLTTVKNAYKKSGTSTQVTSQNIPPKSLGLVAPMFKEIKITVSFAVSVKEVSASVHPSNLDGRDFRAKITITYDYKHPSGSNGYSMYSIYSGSPDAKGKWTGDF
jgi:hypothetical protein|tara:strand:- start:2438 stop:2857 length:420 start_codon:yes stop_codon:yes gene_type:complete